jgi:hypothetical protein
MRDAVNVGDADRFPLVHPERRQLQAGKITVHLRVEQMLGLKVVRDPASWIPLPVLLVDPPHMSGRAAEALASDGAEVPTHWWIVVGVAVICLLGGILARSQSGLDRKERAVVRRAAGPLFFNGGSGPGALLYLLVLVLLCFVYCFAYYRHRTAVKKVVGFNPREQNRAEGVIFHFYELRITRTELIDGYEENARRIRLQGLTATVTKDHGDVHIAIEGPDTKFVYSMPNDLAGFNLRRARRFAALLNYEASLQGAPL